MEKVYCCTSTNKNGKKCSNKLKSYISLDYYERKCHIHNTYNFDIGICYNCQGECNPSSQVCGRCARMMTMQLLGW